MIRFIQQAIRSAGTALRRKAGGADQSVEDFILSVGTEYEPAPLPTPPMANQGWWGQRLEYVKTPPSYVFNESLGDYDYARDLSIAKPTVSVGDILLINVDFMEWSGTGAPSVVTPPTGFTLIDSDVADGADSTNHVAQFLYGRVIDGSEGSTFSVTGSAGIEWTRMFCLVVTGGSALGAANSWNGGPWTLARRLPGITTTEDNSLVLAFTNCWDADVGSPRPSGWTEAGDIGDQMIMFSKVVTTAGAIGNTDYDETDLWTLRTAVTVEIRPA